MTFHLSLNTKSKILLIGVLGEPYLYHNLEDFTRIGDFTWRVSDCEELSGGYLQEMMGLVYLVMLSPACHMVEDQLLG